MPRVKVVKEQSRASRWWWAVLAALATLLLWQSYHLGSLRGALRVGENLDDRAALLAIQDRSFVILQQQQERLQELTKKLETQRQLTDLEIQAGVEMQKELQAALLDKHQLLEQLQFYENILGSEAAKAGVRVSDIQLRPGADAQNWSINVTMTQVKKHDVRASGKITLSLYGQQAGQPLELTLAQVHPAGIDSVKFGYRYFQHLTLPVRLPEGFEPEELAIEIAVRRPKASQLLEQREWLALLR
jgi:TolA-binding protein